MSLKKPLQKTIPDCTVAEFALAAMKELYDGNWCDIHDVCLGMWRAAGFDVDTFYGNNEWEESAGELVDRFCTRTLMDIIKENNL